MSLAHWLSVKALGAILFMAMSPILPAGEIWPPKKVDLRASTPRTKKTVELSAIHSNDKRFVASLAQSDDGKKHFAFGFLEFDWDPRIRGSLPGFDMWPVQEL